MLDRPRVVKALDEKREGFQSYRRFAGNELQRYQVALAHYARSSYAEVEERLRDVARPGARSTVEREAGRAVVLPFGERFANHQEARAWAISVLRGVRTVAVDGSQITPSRDFSVPVGAVQVGWFENPHDDTAQYTKDILFEALSPDDLERPEEGTGRFPDVLVNLRRFELECAQLEAQMKRLQGIKPEPVCFFDGSLVISFAAQMRPDLQRKHIDAVCKVLDASAKTGVPLVGYVDTSYATDFTEMLRHFSGEEERPRISDGELLGPQMDWGDRSEALVCARRDRLFERENADRDYYEQVHFVYLKTSATNAPVRLDLPRWLLEAGKLEQVLDVVRAECVVGTGYPYAVEAADAMAVITMADRERFYRVFQDFLSQLGQDMRYARKAYSKRMRR